MRRLVRAVLALVLASLIAVAAAAAWLAGTQSGLRWLLRHAPAELSLENPRGTLASGVAFDRVAWAGSEAIGVSFQLDLDALLYGTVSIGHLQVDSLRAVPPPAGTGGEPGVLPFRIRIAGARISRVAFMDYQIRDLVADYSGGPTGHRAQAAFSAFGAPVKMKAALSAHAALEEIEAQVRNLDLAAIDSRLPHTDLRAEARGKPARGTKLAGTVDAANARPGPLDEGRLPVAKLSAAFATDFESLGFQDLRAALAPGGTISGEGDLGRAESAIRLQVRELNLRGFYSTLRATRLAGTLQGVLTAGRQRVQGTLSQDDLSLTAEAERTGDRIEVRSLRARAAGGEATGSARVTLGAPVRVEAALDLARFDPARFGDYPAGSINGAVGLDGEWGDKARGGRLRWRIDDSTLAGRALASAGRARIDGERVRDADAWLEWGEGRATARGALGAPQDRLDWTLHVPSLAAYAEGIDGEVSAEGTAAGGYRRPRVTVSAQASALRLGSALAFDRATLEAAGTLDEHDAAVTAKNVDLDLSAKLHGGWGGQGWRGELRSLRNMGRYPLAQRAPSTLEAGPGRAVLGRFDAELAGGGIVAQGLRWEAGRLSSSGTYSALPAQWIISLLNLEKPPSATLLLDGDWDLVSTPRLNGRVTARRSGGDLTLPGPPSRDLGLERAALDARFTDGRIAATLDAASTLGTAHVEGGADGIDPASPVKFVAELQLADLRGLTEPLFTQGRISGRVGATLKGSGTLGAPVLAGTLRGDGLGLDVPPYGVALKDGRLRAELEGDRLRVLEASIAGGEGRFYASGILPLRPAAGGARLDWKAERLQVFGRPDLRLVVSGEGSAGFDQGKLALHGKLLVDSGRIEYKENNLPVLGEDVEIAGRPRGGAGGARQAKREPLPVDLDVQLDLGRNLALRALGFDGKLAGEVHLTSQSTSSIQAKGRVRAVNARFLAYGQELEVDPGSLVFDGPIEKPGLDISAWRRHQQVEAGVHVTGTPDAPHIELISNPPVPEQEKLSWLVLGRAPTSGADLAVLEATTGALLGSGSGPSFSRRLANRVGLDELTVRSSSQASANSSQAAANVFALGKRLSDQLYVGFEQTLGATQEYIVKVDYALTQRLSLRGTTGTTSGVGLFFRYSWD
jgi:translocation and assembly module TamB